MQAQDRRDNPNVNCGTIVSLPKNSRLMTVERIETSSFGDVASCAWFDGDSLNYNRVPLSTLDVLDHDIIYCDMARGLEVRLRSGGPVMTVMRAIKGEGSALCEWDGPMGMMRRREFPVDCLNTSMMDMPCV